MTTAGDDRAQTMKTTHNLLAEHPFFLGLERSDLELLAGCARNVHFAAGERILSEGRPADRFYVIRSGRVALGLFSPDRGEWVLDTLHSGDVLGWSWLFEPYRWHFDATAVDSTSAVALEGECLRAKCEADPRFGYGLVRRFAQIMEERLRSTRLRLLDLYGNRSAR